MNNRIGTRSLSFLSDHSLRFQSLPSITLGSRLILEADDGRKLRAEVTELDGDGVTALVSAPLTGWKKDEVTVWIDSPQTSVTPLVSPLWGDKPRRWLSGVPAWDALFPCYQGDRVLLKTPDQTIALDWAARLVRSAAGQRQVPVYVGLNTSPVSLRQIKRLWAELGLDEAELWVTLGTGTCLEALSYLQDAIQHALHLASKNVQVCLVLRDLDSWFNLFCESRTLQGHQTSMISMVDAFHGELLGTFEKLWPWRSQVTVMAFLNDWQRRGRPSSLWGLRGYFDLALPMSSTKGITLDGDVSYPQGTEARRQATALRRQFKSFQRKAIAQLSRGEALSETLSSFRVKLERYLSLTEGEGASPWTLLGDFRQSELDQLPRDLLIEYLPQLEDVE